MDSDFLISVVVPTYNRALLLERCILSVVNQTYRTWELIVVDDGSTDGTSSLLKEYISTDKRIRYLKRGKSRRKGANSCRNIGIEESTGQYIAFLDSDDEWNSERLEKAAIFLAESNAKAIYSGAIIKHGVFQRRRESRPLKSKETAFDFVLSNDSFSQTSTMIVRSDFLSSIRFDEYLQRHQDFDFFIRVNEVANWTYFENYDVTVFWDRKPVGTHIDFESCMVFYQTHVQQSNDRSVRVNYLSYILESCAKLNPSTFALHFFKNELLKEGVKLTARQRFILRFPEIFHNLYLLKKMF